MLITMDEAVLRLRRDSHCAQLIRDAYLDADTHASAERFLRSGEFMEAQRLVGDRRTGTILDLGAGNGIASYAFSRSGARLVYALEPDPSHVVGRGAITQITAGLAVELIDAYGEDIPLPDQTVDVVYARQVLHHTRDLHQVLRECTRVLKPRGAFLACREHVVDDTAQLQAFLRNHPIHQLVGNENAFPLGVYLKAIHQSGLSLKDVIGHWDSVINAFPGVQTQAELSHYPQYWLRQHLGAVGTWAGAWQPIRWLIWQWLKRPVSGRLYTFWAVKQ
jgi:ubiquinone/menaquinone biosynthesis C-methylase UbiE